MVLDRRIAVLSDIHANAFAFRTAVALARSIGFDEMVVLGDLLTYGCHVSETLEIAQEIARVDRAAFILGNHDQLYLDLAVGNMTYYEKLPAWLRESIDWTAVRLNGVDLRTIVPWRERIVFGNTLLAHANPFTYPDWAYLTDAPSFARATGCLREESLQFGIFGHTHRHRIFVSSREAKAGDLLLAPEMELDFPQSVVGAVTVTALGQPRDQPQKSRIFVAEPSDRGIAFRTPVVNYDLDRHIAGIDCSGMSEATASKLKSYFI